jgi:Sulfotransferase family
MSLIGCVDSLAGTSIFGWAADDADFNRQLEVEVFINSAVVATLRCIQFRGDLRAAGIGDGCKAFAFEPSAYLKPGRNLLEVRFAGLDLVVPKGQGHWVTPRGGNVPAGERALIAAIEAYHEFTPGDQIFAAGAGLEGLEYSFHSAHVPFRSFVLQPEKADVAIRWMRPPSSAEIIGTPGLAAIGVVETPAAAEELGRVFEERGIQDVMFESIPSFSGRPALFAFGAPGDSQVPRAPAAPLLGHIHVPKCAGTSFRVLLERHFGPRHLSLYIDDTYFVYNDAALRSYLLRNPETLGFSSHHVRSFPRWVAGRRILYVTFLRDPVQQFISYMTHIKKRYAEITSQSLLASVPPDTPHLTLREFARWLLTRDCDIPFRENHNVNFFARHSSPAAADRLQAAQSALESFFFVGITERMDESMEQLRARSLEAGLDFPPDPIPAENTSADHRDDLSWVHAGDEVGALLLRSVEKDRQLYEWALARFNE